MTPPVFKQFVDGEIADSAKVVKAADTASLRLSRRAQGGRGPSPWRR
jgi:hypothetical protein